MVERRGQGLHIIDAALHWAESTFLKKGRSALSKVLNWIELKYHLEVLGQPQDKKTSGARKEYLGFLNL